MPHELSTMLPLCNDMELSISTAYDFFSTHLNNPTQRLYIFGKPVYFEAYEMVENKIVGFWHLISTTKINLSVLPCTNDAAYEHCAENCVRLTRLVETKNEKQTRSVCLYRASHLPWIIDIIRLANEKNAFISCWKLKDSHNRIKLYLRYKSGVADYILIFSDEKKYYRLLTAYPVFMVRERSNFDQDYKNYAWIYTP